MLPTQWRSSFDAYKCTTKRFHNFLKGGAVILSFYFICSAGARQFAMYRHNHMQVINIKILPTLSHFYE